jgi:cell division protein FtsW (lipid II flippase)/cell division protein FtsI/penicillin-binding protein 2
MIFASNKRHRLQESENILTDVNVTTIRERILLAIASIFIIVGVLILFISTPQLLVNLTFALVAWITSFAIMHVFLTHHLPERDPFLLPTASLLTGIGLLFIGRLAPNFLPRQTIWLFVSSGTLIVIARISHDLRWLRRFRYTWLFGGLALLGVTIFLGTNPSGQGPRLWLGFFGIYFQPAELLKLLLIAYMASYLAERQKLLVTEGYKLGRWRLPPLAYVGPLLAMFGLAILLQGWQQDLGAAMLFFFTFLAMLYLATNQWRYVVTGLALFMAAGAVGYSFSDKVALRIDGWLNPWPEAADRAFQIVQSLLAFGSGGMLGRGMGLGEPTYIPAVHTDFVFAAISEELGLIGALAVITLYSVLLIRGFRIAARARQPFEQFLAAGLAAGIVIQSWVIMAGNAKLAPIAGVTLPFVSYGGSSILTSFIALALLLRISNQPTSQPANPIGSSLFRLSYTLITALALLAITCGYWAIIRAKPLRAREDNPRRVLYEQRIVRGRILDRRDTVLADVEIADDGTVTRRYPVPEAAPIVGYASLRYGTGGIESAFDPQLRGDAGRTTWQATWDELLHYAPRGRDIRLTIDADLQSHAQHALQTYSGAIVVLDASTGDILAMASNPTFEPSQLDATWDELRQDPDAPLVNRATQGLYQPGTTIQTFWLAQALEIGIADLDIEIPSLQDPVAVNGTQLGCASPPAETHTLADAYTAACPAPFIDLSQDLTSAGLTRAIYQWALTNTPPPLEIPTEAADWNSKMINTTDDLHFEAIGQGKLTVSPLQMALATSTLANGGTMPAPRLVLYVQSNDGNWQKHLAEGTPIPVTSPAIADKLLSMWTPYGDGLVGHLGLAIAGKNRPPHAWFLGVIQTENAHYAITVLLEHPRDINSAAEIGTEILQKAAEGP